MGLDMYLEGHEYTPSYPPENREVRDGYAVKKVVYELGYWRKHPNLHGYIVNTFADGKDECQDIELGKEDLEKILAASEADQLPHTSGFFFGSSHPDDKKSTREQVTKAIEWIDKKSREGSIRYVVYRASW